MCGFEMIPLHLDFKNNDFFFPFVCLVSTKMLKWFNSQMNCQFSSCNEKRSIRAWQQESFMSVSFFMFTILSCLLNVIWYFRDTKMHLFCVETLFLEIKMRFLSVCLNFCQVNTCLIWPFMFVQKSYSKKKTLVIAYFLCNWKKWKIFLKCVLHMSRCFFLHTPRIFYGW